MTKKQAVKAWEETVSFPTYAPPPADLNPMYLDKRVNQGTSGRVYPYPFTDKLSNESEPQDYTAVYLENEYIRLMMLPQIGGRIHEALDKTNGYHFIYRQHVDQTGPDRPLRRVDVRRHRVQLAPAPPPLDLYAHAPHHRRA